MSKRALYAAGAAVVALVAFAYANHFHNGFHFDDSHAIVDNPSVRDVANIPRFFSDPTTFSILPLNQAYRPVLQATLAIDYRIGGGYRPVVFQADTFAWFLALLVAMWLLSRVVLRACGAQDAEWIALVATAVYGLHPVCAETVNYVIQRGDLLSTFGVVAALALFAAKPAWRRSGAYLLPVVFALLAKPTALVFPLLVFAYVRLFEEPRGTRRAAIAALPSLATVIVALLWIQAHTPPTYTPGASSKAAYWMTQPFVALRYLGAFFLPIHLSADNDWPLLDAGDPRVYVGLACIITLAWAACAAARRRDTRPIAFGLWWFLIGLLPTSILPLAEVANDHRMFCPFVGLSLAVVSAAAIAWQRVATSSGRRLAAAALVVAVLFAETAGVRARNQVWSSDEALWHDVTVKSPRNGRGLMNYGLARMERGDYAGAVEYFERALAYTPDYPLLYVNLGIGYGGLGRRAEAERAFAHAITLAPSDWRTHSYYGRWLLSTGRTGDAISQLSLATSENPLDPMSAPLLAKATATLSPPDALLARSLADYQAGRYRDCIEHAQRALALRPGYAEAYNNIAAGHIALGEWDEGIRAAEEAVRIKPELALARNNLAYAKQRRGERR